jgi:hypothetical protein
MSKSGERPIFPQALAQLREKIPAVAAAKQATDPRLEGGGEQPNELSSTSQPALPRPSPPTAADFGVNAPSLGTPLLVEGVMRKPHNASGNGVAAKNLCF